MPETTSAKFEPRRTDSSCAASWTPSAPGPASAASTSSISGAPRPFSAAPREGGRHDHERHEGRRGDAERDGQLAARDPHGHGHHEADARERLHQHEAAVQREVLVPGQPAAREVAGGVGERAHHEHVVQLAEVVKDVSDQLIAQGQRGDQEERREAELDGDRRAQGVVGVAARPALGDRPREQLFDRPVDHRDDHEHDGPQDIDALRLKRVQHVAGNREIGERQDSGERDPDRQDPRAAAVGALLAVGGRRVR